MLKFLLLSAASALVAPDEIHHLPGWDAPLPSRQFSGYLDIAGGHFIHYWLVMSERDPANDPTVVWLNGGPGCSSLDGLFYEHGPFRINPANNSQLMRFDQTWAGFANMVYIEAPVGVGFSFSLNVTDYKFRNDDNTADDNRDAMARFFELYPEFKKNDFFITGESYGGVYVPTMAEAILKADDAGAWTGAKLKGIGVGNGCTGTEIGVCGGEGDRYLTEYLLTTAFVPESLKRKVRSTCDLTTLPVDSDCEMLIQEMHNDLGHINLYNVYGDCISGTEEHMYGQTHSKISKPVGASDLGGPDACIDSRFATAYLNQLSVIKAAHLVTQPFKWATCANQIHYTSTRPNLPRDTYPYLAEKIRVLIYNGDWDACVPFTDNEAWTSGMGFAVKKDWHAWVYNNGQVGGYATEYNTTHGFGFITVRGGRHEVPETAPFKALEMFKRLTTFQTF